jgi:Tol biopolymer transport system component
MDIWVMPSDGGPAVQITHDPASELGPSWSPDGRDLAFHSSKTQSGITNIFVIPATGGNARQVTDLASPAFQPAWSQDGSSIAFQMNQQLWQVALAGGRPEPLVETRAVNQFRFSDDGKRIYFVRSGNLWALTLPERSERRLTLFSGKAGSLGGAIATHGADLYFTWSSDVGDIWVMDVGNPTHR